MHYVGHVRESFSWKPVIGGLAIGWAVEINRLKQQFDWWQGLTNPSTPRRGKLCDSSICLECRSTACAIDPLPP